MSSRTPKTWVSGETITATAVNDLEQAVNTHTHTATEVADSTSTGRSVLTAASQAAARTAIGAGTSSLAIGTTSSTAKAGDYAPASTDISDSTSTGRSVLTAASQAAARTAIGAGTSSLAIGTTSTTAKAGDYAPTAASISDSTTVGRSVLLATDAAAARTAIGAGTSSLALGTTSSTAKAGDYAPTAANISDATTVGRSILTATDAAAVRTASGAAAVTTMDLQDGLAAPNVVTADYTLTTADIQNTVSVNSSSAVTITIPVDILRQGSRVRIGQAGVGEVQVVGATGVTLRNSAGRSPTTRGQFSTLVVHHRSVNTWWIEGDADAADLSGDPAITAAIATAVNYAPIHLVYTGSAWPTRPNTVGTNRPVYWVGPSPGPSSGGTTTGGTAAYAPGDMLHLT